MKPISIAALALAAAALHAGADDAGTKLVANNHGGYNVASANPAKLGTLPFFGAHGFASHVVAKSKEPPKFILVPVVQDDGHVKHVVYHKVFFATAAEAAAAKAQQ